MRRILFILVFPALLLGLEKDPWFSQLLEFHFLPTYEYSYFTKLDRSVPVLNSRIDNHLLRFDLNCTVPDTWNWEAELEFADTTEVSWGYRSFALQGRKLWLDDVCGDPISLTTGLLIREASSRMRRALPTPYHARLNFELHTAFGKEWSRGCFWIFRSYGLFAIGQGNQGSPWLRGDWVSSIHFCNKHELRLYAKSYWGLGKNKLVPLDPFPGWGKIAHQSIDVGGGYRLEMETLGTLCFDYLYRVYAKSYPEKVNAFLLSYDLPFCPF